MMNDGISDWLMRNETNVFFRGCGILINEVEFKHALISELEKERNLEMQQR